MMIWYADSSVLGGIDVVFKQVRDLVWEFAGKRIENKSDIMMDSDLVYDLGLDSLDKLELCAICEEYFKCKITDTEAAALNTVQDIVYFIEAKQKEAAQ